MRFLRPTYIWQISDIWFIQLINRFFCFQNGINVKSRNSTQTVPQKLSNTYIEFLYPDSLSKSHRVTSLEQLSVAELSGDGE